MPDEQTRAEESMAEASCPGCGNQPLEMTVTQVSSGAGGLGRRKFGTETVWIVPPDMLRIVHDATLSLECRSCDWSDEIGWSHVEVGSVVH